MSKKIKRKNKERKWGRPCLVINIRFALSFFFMQKKSNACFVNFVKIKEKAE
jgi:hypothetical protein